ncbi:MAG: FAD-dependent monooxygenase, partial [Acidobacteria bacterium]|nr:FAD-dependent monooxygenase [Acidobacteriota bacterium]
MRILIIGGGPGGLYSGLLLKKGNPTFEVTVVDRNPPDATYGWGIVFSEQTLASFRDADLESYEEITRNFVRWDAIDVQYHDAVIRSGGHVFAGISRTLFLQILQQHCGRAGVQLAYGKEIKEPAEWEDYDLVIGADGFNSLVRNTYAARFQPSLSVEAAKYIWLGTSKVFEAFTFLFCENEHGVFQAHLYPFSSEFSTVIVECDETTWRQAGLDRATETESLEYCEKIFEKGLQGSPLLSNRSSWINFLTIKNKVWHDRNIVLLGDAVHTAHFSIGSGTKMAMEDAIALARALRQHTDLEAALTDYELERRPYVEGIQRAAQESRTYFENTRRYFHLEPLQFTFHLLTRSGRITYENMRRRDARFMDEVDRWFAERAYGFCGGFPRPAGVPAPSLTPLRLRDMTVGNRLVYWPTSQDCAEDGMPNECHQRQMSLRDLGDAGAASLVLTEPCAVSPEGRITPGTCGLYRAEHVAAWTRIVECLHKEGQAKVAMALAHAGRRGSSRPRREGLDRPLREGNWPLLSASTIPYTPWSQVPKEMDASDRAKVSEDFVRAARGAERAGFDALVLHCAHGYLLASFLSPLSNRRTDAYGGSLENRMRFPLEVFEAVREVWPASKPLFVAIPATDWAKGGFQPDDAVVLSQRLQERGCDLITALSGQATYEPEPAYGVGFLNSISDRIRNQTRLPVMAAGHIATADHANT